MSTLVTGGLGFIGANFIEKHFSISEQRLINIDCITYAANPNLSFHKTKAFNYKHYNIDISKEKSIDLIIDIIKKESVQKIVHFAAESHVDNSINDPFIFLKTNVLGTFNLLESFKKGANHEKENLFLHVSTDEVYGSLKSSSPPSKENDPYLPNSPYAASKASSDHIARSYFQTYQLPIIISNCSNNFGKYQHFEKLIPKVINNAKNKKPIPIYGNGENIRDWIYVKDHVEAINCLLDQGKIGNKYNISSINEIKNIDLVKKICHLIEEYLNLQKDSLSELISFVDDRPGHDFRYSLDTSNIENELNWKPKFKFEDALIETIEHYLK